MFIVFEGIDGVGKSTQINLLVKYLKSKNKDFVKTAEPGGTPIGKHIRDILLTKGDISVSAVCESYLFAASRAELCQKVILPALQKGKTVISDRFLDSSIAYQSAGRSLATDTVLQINKIATLGIKPDWIILLDSAPKNAKNDKTNKDRIEKEDVEFYTRVRNKYLQLADDNDRYIVIDATLPINEIHKTIIKTIGL